MDERTHQFYQREAPRYTLSGRQSHARDLDAFLDRLTPGARVLELGCGAGKDSARIAARGFALDATDGSLAMVQKARERTDLPVRVMAFHELDAREDYDAVWAHASLHHQPWAGLPDVFARIARALRGGGWFYANYKLGDGETRDDYGRLYNFPPRADLLALYDTGAWDLPDIRDYRDGGLDKVMRDWIAITARKRP